jgi:hypothetical protein
MDGGGIRGLIPAQVTDYLERALYKEADRLDLITSATSDRSKNYITIGGIEVEGRLPLSKFFEIMAGTSIGGIMASALAIPYDGSDTTGTPDREPKFYSDEVTRVGRDMTDYAFDPNIVIVLWAQVIMAVGGISAGFAGAYFCSKYDSADKDRKEAIKIVEEEIDRKALKL